MKSRLFVTVIPILLLLFSTAQAQQFTGYVDYRLRIQVQPLANGTIVDVPVKVGDIVQKGQVLIRFDSRRQEARVQRVKSQIERLELELKRISDKFDRQQELFDRGSLSLLEFEEAEHGIKIAQAELTAARAKLAAVQYRLEQTALVSPINNAIVVFSDVYAGMNYIQDTFSDAHLMTLGSYGQYVVQIRVPFEKRNTLQAGDSVSVMIEDSIFSANVEFPTLDPEFLFDDASGMPEEAVAENDRNFKIKAVYPVNLRFNAEQESILPGTPAIIQFDQN